MLRIESHLEEVRKTATVAARAARAAGTDRSRMNDVVARDVLRERRYRVVAIDALGHVDVPLRPAVGGPAGAGWLHRGDAVRIPGKARAEPRDHNVTVRVRGDPGKDVGPAGGRSAVHAHRHGPVSSRVGGRREEDALVVRPDDVGVAEVVHGERRKDVGRAGGGSGRAGGAREDFVVREGEGHGAELGVGGHADVDGAKRCAVGVIDRIVGRHECGVEIPLAGAPARVAVDLDLCRHVRAVRRHDAAGGGESRGVDGLAGAGGVGESAVARALHLDVESGHIVIAHVDRGRIVDRIVPHAVVARNRRAERVRRSEEGVTAIPGTGRGHAGNEREAGQRYVRNGGVVRVGGVHGDVGVTASGRHAEVGGTADVLGASAAAQSEDAAVVGLALVLERQGAVSIRRAVDGRIPAPQIDAPGHAADRLDVDRPLGIDAVSGLDALYDEREGAEPRRNRSELRQTEALIGAEAVDARTDEGRDGLGAASGTRLARAQVLVRRIGIGSLCDAPVGGSGPDQRGQQRTQERPERP